MPLTRNDNYRACVALFHTPAQHRTCPSCHPVSGDENLPSLTYIPPNFCATKDVQCRCTQALRCFKAALLQNRFHVPSPEIYGSEAQVYSKDHMSHLSLIHYKSLCQISSIRRTFYHKVISPSKENCSNDLLMKLAYERAPRLRTSSQYTYIYSYIYTVFQTRVLRSHFATRRTFRGQIHFQPGPRLPTNFHQTPSCAPYTLGFWVAVKELK